MTTDFKHRIESVSAGLINIQQQAVGSFRQHFASHDFVRDILLASAKR